ncbi:MarR family winged helix-turn-helix transcriptional regulator [Nocardia bovistercoris]|uniref:MarR family transcriptional regulator n=1 Tax=Nocardia bovistercoris TaxID=2785916 RepID=A0A931IDT4_9NOCA|nr:MarR family transcriptional regulator [Nocardia bovistercoris]MBH0779579.1 MarR family transcriptional regulator [Nocardia bovistercoris]
MSEIRRPDLAAMIVPLVRGLMAAEQPLLDRHGLTMWEYAVLLGLDSEPVYTQTALARSIGADKTRVIGVLDGLQRRGLIRREPDPADRRVNLVSITDEGRGLRDATQRDIQRHEEESVLAALPPGDRKTFLRALAVLHANAVADRAAPPPSG